MHIWLNFVALIIGAFVLAWSADRFIASSSALAKNLKISPLVVGLVAVGFGTSFPELVVSFMLSIRGKMEIAVGNVIGSNIANIGLVIGIALIIAPIQINSRLIKREFPVLIIVMGLLAIILFNGELTILKGILLLSALVLYLIWLLDVTPKPDDPLMTEWVSEEQSDMTTKKALLWFFVGIAFMYVSSRAFVTSAVNIAKYFGLSDLVIGLTIVTIGTSLPEIAVTISGMIRKEHDIVMGHIVGSNIFNSLAVLALPALISPGQFPSAVFYRDYPVMLFFTLVLWLILFLRNKKKYLQRAAGILLLLIYLAYLVYLF